MVREHRNAHSPAWAAITSIADTSGVGTEALRRRLRRAEIDRGNRPGMTTAERERIRELEWENREPRRADELLKATLACFARHLDPRSPTW
jgi:transposase